MLCVSTKPAESGGDVFSDLVLASCGMPSRLNTKHLHASSLPSKSAVPSPRRWQRVPLSMLHGDEWIV